MVLKERRPRQRLGIHSLSTAPRRLARSGDVSAMQGEPTELQWLSGEKATLQYVVSLRAKPILKEGPCWETLQCAGQKSRAAQYLLPHGAGSGCPRGRAAPSRTRQDPSLRSV